MRSLATYLLTILIISGATKIYAQTGLHTEVVTDKSRAYVGEPVKLSIFVYTPTWFTRGVNPGNIKIEGAFTVFFRTVSQSKQIDGNTYAGVEMIYNVFPYESNDIIIPSLDLEVETPDPGGYKGVKKAIKTKEKKIDIISIPAETNPDTWLVADNVDVKENWIGNLQNLKVGDVIERKISINAIRTVAELLPPVIWDSIPGVSSYPNRAEVSSNKTRTEITATRNESIRYLFESEGVITMPEIIISWYNPQQKKFYKRTLKSKELSIAPNPNLGILESVRDSLAIAMQSNTSGDNADQSKGIFGYKPWQILTATLLSILFIFGIFKIIAALIKWLKARKAKYLQSEKYYFDMFINAYRKGDLNEAISKLYNWIDLIDISPKTLEHFYRITGDNGLLKEIKVIQNYTGRDHPNESISLNMNVWKNARSRYIKKLYKSEYPSDGFRLNP